VVRAVGPTSGSQSAEKPGQERNPFGGSTGFESLRIAEELRYLGHIDSLGFHTFILITPH